MAEEMNPNDSQETKEKELTKEERKEQKRRKRLRRRDQESYIEFCRLDQLEESVRF